MVIKHWNTKKGIALKASIIVMMFGFFIVATRALYLADKTEMPASVMFQISIGIVSLLGLTVLCLVHTLDTTPVDDSSRLFLCMIVLVYLGVVFDNITWVVSYLERTKYDILIKYILDIGSFLVMPILLIVFWNYQNRVFVGESKSSSKMKTVIHSFGIIDIIFILIGSATKFIFYINANGKYTPAKGLPLIFIYPIFVFLCCTIENLRADLPIAKKLSLLSVGISPAVTIAFLMLLPKYNFSYVMFFMDLLLVYGTIQSQRSAELAEHGKKIAEQNEKLIEQQTQIMISQIQPHFLYNTLTSIHHLCDINTELAQKTIQDFSAYLRGNMDGIKSLTPIPFEKELSHTKTYLAIELLRFSDILNIEYDIQVTDFEIPALTLQPLVENAVKYGIRSREDGGTVSISTKRENGKIYVSVHDDGMGFDPSKNDSDGRSHIGIENTRRRLQLMVNADLIIDSKIGTGTTATIVLEDKNESVISR